jgi:predicted ester cyclase
MTNAERYRELTDRLFRQRDDGAFDELFAPSYTGEYGGKSVTRESMRETVMAIRNAFGDTRYDVLETAEVGDKLWAYWKVSAIHRGPMFGIAATHAPIVIHGLTFNRYVDGKIVWGVVQWDRMGLAETLKAASAQLALGV